MTEQSSRPLRVKRVLSNPFPRQGNSNHINTMLLKTTSKLGLVQASVSAKTEFVEPFTEGPRFPPTGFNIQNDGLQSLQGRSQAVGVSMKLLGALKQNLTDEKETARLAPAAQNDTVEDLRIELNDACFKSTQLENFDNCHSSLMRKDIAAKDSAIATCESQLREVRAELQKLKQDMEQKDVEFQKATQALASTQVDNHNLDRVRKLLSCELVNAGAELTRERAARKDLEKKYNFQENWIKRAENQVERRNKHIEGLEKEVIGAKNTIKKEVEKFQTELTARDAEIYKLKALNTRLADQINFLEHTELSRASTEVPSSPKGPVPQDSTNAAPMPTRHMLLDLACRDVGAGSTDQGQRNVKRFSFLSALLGMFRRRAVITSQPWK